jgi:hypothetical protein
MLGDRESANMSDRLREAAESVRIPAEDDVGSWYYRKSRGHYRSFREIEVDLQMLEPLDKDREMEGGALGGMDSDRVRAHWEWRAAIFIGRERGPVVTDQPTVDIGESVESGLGGRGVKAEPHAPVAPESLGEGCGSVAADEFLPASHPAAVSGFLGLYEALPVEIGQAQA